MTKCITDEQDNVVWRAIYMAPRDRFLSAAEYLFVLAHETIHAVGRNLRRPWGGRSSTNWTFNTTSSDSEERVAELGANLLMMIFNIDYERYAFRDELGRENDDELLEAYTRVSYLLGHMREVVYGRSHSSTSQVLGSTV